MYGFPSLPDEMAKALTPLNFERQSRKRGLGAEAREVVRRVLLGPRVRAGRGADRVQQLRRHASDLPPQGAWRVLRVPGYEAYRGCADCPSFEDFASSDYLCGRFGNTKTLRSVAAVRDLYNSTRALESHGRR